MGITAGELADKIVKQWRKEYNLIETANIIREKEYLFIRCNYCKDRTKLAKNKGSYWIEYENNLSDFLLDHNGCGTANLEVEWV